MPCEHCGKPLRRCKRVDVVDMTIHFACIKKIQKQRYDDALERLVKYLKEKNVILVI
jgi:hypothetical protein